MAAGGSFDETLGLIVGLNEGKRGNKRRGWIQDELLVFDLGSRTGSSPHQGVEGVEEDNRKRFMGLNTH